LLHLQTVPQIYLTSIIGVNIQLTMAIITTRYVRVIIMSSLLLMADVYWSQHYKPY